MTKFILHGGYTGEDNELNRGFFAEIVKDVSNGGTVLLCYFANEVYDEAQIAEKFERHVGRFKNYVGDKNITFVLANKKNFLEQFKQANAVFFNGGKTENLLAALEAFPDFKNYVDGKTIAGSSAGAYMMGTLNVSHKKEESREGLALLPIKVVCHFESPSQPPMPESLEIIKNSRPDLELVLLRDYEWKVIIKQ